MKKIMIIIVAALFIFAGCSTSSNTVGDSPMAIAVSPDGRNSIRLYVAPLAYEVLRDRKIIVEKSNIDLKVNGDFVANKASAPKVSMRSWSGKVDALVYKKDKIDLAAMEAFADFGDWGVRIISRNDGVAYRFETMLNGEIVVNDEKVEFAVADQDAKAMVYRQLRKNSGQEEKIASQELIKTATTKPEDHVYLPLVFTTKGATVAVIESDVYDYPIMNLVREQAALPYRGVFDKWPTKTVNSKGWGDKKEDLNRRRRKINVVETADYLVKTSGKRSFPWRGMILVDSPSKLCEADLIYAIARGQANYDFSWIKPGKVAWDWWNAWNNKGEKEGCTTKEYERFIDFAAKNGVEYVIFDEGWSAELNIWKYSPKVDVPHLIKYGQDRGVGIILWMAWAQVYGDEAHVADYFGKLGAKGFKVDFMDRGDADVERFLWKFADECAKRKLIIDYHGAHHPTGQQRAYPNILNYEGIHGLECMKWFRNQDDFMMNDVQSFFGRMTMGQMDYTPGAMDNYPIGKYPLTDKKAGINMHSNPGSVGTRAHQMAMMVTYEAPLQMLSDAPNKYERCMDSFGFMSKVPVVWSDTIGLGGDPSTYAAVARKAKDGSWYAAAIGNSDEHEVVFSTSFLGSGEWRAEIYCDAIDSNEHPTKFVCRQAAVKAGEKMTFHLAKGGGFIVKFVKK